MAGYAARLDNLIDLELLWQVDDTTQKLANANNYNISSD